MAIGNVLVPAWIKAQGHTVALMTIYGTGLVLGGTLGSLLTAPVTEATDAGASVSACGASSSCSPCRCGSG